MILELPYKSAADDGVDVSLEGLAGSFDIIFLDVDKINYGLYVEIILSKRLLSPRGVIFCDNGTWP